MATYSSVDAAWVLIGGRSLANLITKMTIDKVITKPADITALSDTFGQFKPTGGKGGRVEGLEGFYDTGGGGYGSSDTALVNLATQVACLTIVGDGIGKAFIGFGSLMQGTYRRLANLADLHKVGADFTVDNHFEEGLQLHNYGTETGASGNSASVNNGAGSSAGGSGYVQCSALTLGGYTNVTIKVQHSTNDVDWVDLITFTAITASPTAERKTVAGTVNQYVRATYTFTGAGSGQSVTFMVGFVRN